MCLFFDVAFFWLNRPANWKRQRARANKKQSRKWTSVGAYNANVLRIILSNVDQNDKKGNSLRNKLACCVSYILDWVWINIGAVGGSHEKLQQYAQWPLNGTPHRKHFIKDNIAASIKWAKRTAAAAIVIISVFPLIYHRKIIYINCSSSNRLPSWIGCALTVCWPPL